MDFLNTKLPYFTVVQLLLNPLFVSENKQPNSILISLRPKLQQSTVPQLQYHEP